MLPLTPNQIKTTYANALKLQGAGKFDEALSLYSTILKAAPQSAEVHFQIGRIFLQAGRYAQSTQHFGFAASIKPKEPAIWTAYADAIVELGDPDATAAFLKTAKTAGLPAAVLVALQDKVNPKPAKSRTSIGAARKEEIDALIALMTAGRFEQAEEQAKAAQKANPKVALIADILASAQVRLGKTDEAIANFKKAVALDPNYAEARNNYGRLLLELGRVEEAVVEIRKALKLAPGLALAHQNLGAAYLRLDQTDDAIKRLKKAVSLNDKSVESKLLLGKALIREKQYAEATAILSAAAKLDPARGEIFAMLGQAQDGNGEETAALASFDRAIQLSPGVPLPYSCRALLLQKTGKFAEAEASFRQAIALEPEAGENYRVMVASHKVSAGDPLIQQMIAQYENPQATRQNRRNLGFALSKVMEDTKAYDQVFKYLNTANALMREEFPYDIASREKEVADVMEFFKGLTPDQTLVPGCTDYAPIFVTGMPRSGTTLVEQIISSHSQVSGAGEVGFAAREAYRLIADRRGGLKPFAEVPKADIAALGKSYESFMRQSYPDAPRVTDKSIQTHTYLGLIKMALPQSRMIVVRRDPRDNLLSIYKNMFLEGTHLYSYSLSDLGRYYKLFLKLVAFWQEHFPEWIYVIDYENLIANTEEESRKLIAACGLEWEDQCLDFHKNTRRVDTLSVFQVRQPIYQSSMKAWQRYEDELSELFEALK